MASSLKWAPGITISVDPDAVLDYTMDFTDWLEGGTLSAAVPTAIKCTAGAATIAGNVVKVRVSQVLYGAQVTIRVTTADGQSSDFTLRFAPAPQ